MGHFLLRGRVPRAEEVVRKVNDKVAGEIRRPLPEVQAKSKVDRPFKQQLRCRFWRGDHGGRFYRRFLSFLPQINRYHLSNPKGVSEEPQGAQVLLLPLHELHLPRVQRPRGQRIAQVIAFQADHLSSRRRLERPQDQFPEAVALPKEQWEGHPGAAGEEDNRVSDEPLKSMRDCLSSL